MEKYRVEGIVEVIISTCIELSDKELETLDKSWISKRKRIEAILRDKIHIENFEGNGGTDKLIGVVGRDNAIRYDGRSTPKLINISKLV